MKRTIFKNTIIDTMLLASAVGIAVAVFAPKGNLARADNPKVIEITAKKFEFSPSEITIKKGEPVILRLSSSDRVHGFMSKPLKIDTDIPSDTTKDVAVTPDTAGNFTVICDHYCGTGHGNMKMKVTVVE
ncbi:MAG TPA: cupredoxin domain-containing protein [Candidatus Sulfotelmatobacter sp.]|jgi:cytochrome c oxidase subunit 2|nr:cupredoxin domain-containing protein [Candidatus Sulfotelmatobacter sp.]